MGAFHRHELALNIDGEFGSGNLPQQALLQDRTDWGSLCRKDIRTGDYFGSLSQLGMARVHLQ